MCRLEFEMTNKTEKQLLEELSKAGEKACKACDSVLAESSYWSQFWREETLANIESCIERLNSLGDGTLQIYDKATFPKLFWENIMGSVQKTIWTTNDIGSSSFGNTLDFALLALQKEAADRGVKITRVFIYDQFNEEKMDELVSVMANQLFYDIEVLTITTRQLTTIYDEVGYELDTPDFMIIDDTLAYLTRFHFKSKSFQNTLITSKEALSRRLTIKKRVMKLAEKITDKNIKQFPRTK